MIKRGKILRDTNAGVGLITIEGARHEFTLEGNWDCDIPPKVGMVIEAEVDESGKLSAAWAIDEKQIASEQASLMFNHVKEKSVVYYNMLAELTGKEVLMATAALFAGWFIFSTININLGAFAGKEGLHFTFWQILGLVNNAGSFSVAMLGGNGAGKGIYGALCLAALAGPFLFIFWKHPLAHLGNCLALLLILLVIGSSYMSYMDQMNAGREAMSAFGGAKSQKMMEEFADQAFQQTMKMISIGLGAYISFAASAFLAFIGIKKFLVASAEGNLSPRGSNTRVPTQTGRRSNKFTTPSQAATTNSVSSETSVKSLVSRSCHACAATCDNATSFCEACGTKLT